MPDTRSADQPTMNAVFNAVHQHFMQVIVPMWLRSGWNAELALPYEAVDATHQPLPPLRYRAMACARQLFLFSSLIGEPSVPEAPARAAALFRSLQRHFHDAEHGGWFYSIDPQGAPLDRRKDLYTHAFIVFACAHYWAKVREPLVESILNDALKVISDGFADGDGLYEAVLAEDWSSLNAGPLQNPLMHLAEAFLITVEVRDDAQTQAALNALIAGMQRRFVDAEHGVMLEKPLGAVDNWSEPGHQFEWFYLLESSEHLRGSPLHRSLTTAFAHAQIHGVDQSTGAVAAMLEVDGSMKDGTQRIWAQAEYLRALTLQPDNQGLLARQLTALQNRFLHPGGWNECLDSEGNVSRSDMPSTTPYHLATCYIGLAQYFKDTAAPL